MRAAMGRALASIRERRDQGAQHAPEPSGKRGLML
jgi:hypothetical protein